MMSIDEILERLRTRNLPIVAAESGVNYQSLLAFSKGRQKRVSIEMMKKLSEWLEGQK